MWVTGFGAKFSLAISQSKSQLKILPRHKAPEMPSDQEKQLYIEKQILTNSFPHDSFAYLFTPKMSNMRIAATEFGGRGYFSSRPIPKDTEILRCNGPYTGVIFKPFKKEVCAYCFDDDNGRTQKIKLESPTVATKKSQPAYGGVYFCTTECRDSWLKTIDFDGLIADALNAIETSCSAKKTSGNIEMNYATGNADVDATWKEVEQQQCSKKSNNTHQLESEEYDTARMISIVLVKKYRALHKAIMVDEWNMFSELQSNEAELLKKYPAMLQSYIKVYEFLHATMPKVLRPYLSTDLVRHCVGKEAGNAFGLWQLPLHLESECMGSNLFPEASFFNHSCDPSVRKERIGRDMVFTTTRDILPNEQLYISYGMLNNLGWKERVEQLNSQWHFICGCPRCETEKTGGEWAKL